MVQDGGSHVVAPLEQGSVSAVSLGTAGLGPQPHPHTHTLVSLVGEKGRVNFIP